MQTSSNSSRQTMLWIVGIAIILFCFAAIAAIMGWIPTSIAGGGSAAPIAAAPPPAKAAAAKPHNPPAHIASSAPARSICYDCGVIESVREISQQGSGGAVGGIGGALVGGALGHQVGSGRGNDVATVAGAIGGALAGNEIQKRVTATKSYEVTVRFEDGSIRSFNEAAPNWRAGDNVRVVDGVIRSNR